MLRLESETGWWLITHPDHARLAAAFAGHWGNDRFASPEPRAHVLKGIAAHDDGWAARDAAPQITRQGKPSAFSVELVGKYSAFEEIDLADYLAVRDRAVKLVAEEDAYAAILVSKHTYNLLTERVDRSTIAQDQLPLLDAFLAGQRALQEALFAKIQGDSALSAEERSREQIEEEFRLLQACDQLSLLSCVDYAKPATLLHPLRLNQKMVSQEMVNQEMVDQGMAGTGAAETVTVESLGERYFCLTPYPLDTSPLTITFPCHHVEGKSFASAQVLQTLYDAAELSTSSVTVTA
jgi:hypothetical protein